jgi:hypothetical protein
MQPDKKQLEILLISYFRESLPDFPVGAVIPSESPDFTIRMKNQHILGIELTRLNPENAIPLSEEHLKDIDEKEHLIELVRNIFENSSPYKLFVKFLFSDGESIKSERQMMVAVQIANLIRQEVQNRKTENFFKISLNSSKLSVGIAEILIVHHPDLQTSVWERSNNLGISNDVVDDIRKAIHKKDEKLRIYQKQRLNYYWLLIFTDRLRGVRNFNLAEKVMNHRFQSRFQHVYLFDLIRSDVFQLV